MNATLDELKSWKRDFLSSRNLDWPEGWPLFRYRMTQAEFERLCQMLKEAVGAHGLLDLAARDDFRCLFVLYASGWWSRRYDGRQWAWEPLLSELATVEVWTPTQRSECVTRGLSAWNRSLGDSSGLRFLGAIAVEGGLPMKLLAEARGRIGAILSRVLELAQGGAVTLHTLRDWIESLKHQLPRSYQNETVYTLLADVVRITLDLKAEAKLTAGCDAIVLLNRAVPDWRKRFPLSLEDKHADKLVEQLVRSAAEIKLDQRTTLAPLARALRCEGDIWHLQSELRLADKLSGKILGEFFQITDWAGWSRFCDLGLQTSGACATTSLRKLAGHEDWRVTKPLACFADAAAMGEHTLELTAANGLSARVAVPFGEALEDDLPWVFADDEAGGGAFRRQGGGKVTDAVALVAVPDGWDCQAGEGGMTETAGRMWNDRAVYRVCGQVCLTTPEGECYTINTAQADAEVSSYAWSGARVWLPESTPRQIFRGMPKLHRLDEDGVTVRERYDPVVTGHGGQRYGALTLRHPAAGEVRYRSRVVVLPETARLDIVPRDAQGGDIRLEDWRVAQATLLTSDAHCVPSQTGGTLTLRVESSAAHPPEHLEFELFWAGSTISCKVSLPFPGKGARGFDRDGQPIASGSQIDLGALLGLRLRAVGQGNPEVTLTLASLDGALPARRYPLKFPSGENVVEIRLLDYQNDIQQLLALAESVDSQVKVSLQVGGDPAPFKLRVAGYAVALQKEANSVQLPAEYVARLDAEALKELQIMALRLEHPEDEAVVLSQAESEGVPIGRWRFDPENREPGSWLVYARDARLALRPLLWPVAGHTPKNPDAPDLLAALSLADHDTRQDAIDAAIEALAEHYDDPGWGALERLAGQVGHLPLPTLDLWKRLAHSPRGMAAVALRHSNLPAGFKLCFASELPFAWETIPLDDWRAALARSRQHMFDLYRAEAGEQLWPVHIEAVVQTLTEEVPALDFLLGIVTASLNPAKNKHAQALKYLPAKALLFEDDNCELQKLRRTHPEDQWPADGQGILTQARQDATLAAYLAPPGSYTDSLVNLPLLLAAQVAHGDTQLWFSDAQRIRLLRSYRAFDPDWFDAAYNYTIARCLANDHITLET